MESSSGWAKKVSYRLNEDSLAWAQNNDCGSYSARQWYKVMVDTRDQAQV